jgi:hypothetical protein
MTKDIAKLRQAFLKETEAHWPLAKGSLAFVRRPCVRPQCRACQSGKKHGAWIFTFRQGGRQRCRYVPKELTGLLRRAIANGRRLERRTVELGTALIEAHRQERARKRKGGP